MTEQSQENLSLDEVKMLATEALVGAGASLANASAVAQSTFLAERDGIRSHGLMYVPIYAEHVTCGKVIGDADPVVLSSDGGVVTVDAKNGFAHPAINAGWDAFIGKAMSEGVGVLTVNQSYNCGVLGHHAQRIAEQGLLGICFTHAPASIAPPGGATPLIGTNPFAMAVPDQDGGVLMSLDQSASVVAKSEILLCAREGKPIDPSWAFDEQGQPTPDANAALKGSMAPAGGYKGYGMGLMVEMLASCLSGAMLSKDASPFAGTKGGPPATGQCFMAFNPAKFSGDVFFAQAAALIEAMRAQDGAHIPGDKAKGHRQRTQSEGVWVDVSLLERIRSYRV
ncbi:MAG: Ldh family oxidoreductase [Pseudomonadota bacterium]